MLRPNSIVGTRNDITPYILSVGKLEPRKNIPRLIEAFQQANLKDIDLYIVGPEGWDEKTLHVTRFKLQDNIKFLGYVPDHQLYQLYKNALFFIYPSLYEGFGYPVIEAMSLGCPVACSNNSSLGEIAGNNSITFNPNSIDEIKTSIIKLAKDQSLRTNLSKKGLINSKKFSQEKYINELVDNL